MIEYLLLFAGVVAVLLIALGPGGFASRAVDKSLDLSVDGFVSMSNEVYQNVLREQGASNFGSSSQSLTSTTSTQASGLRVSRGGSTNNSSQTLLQVTTNTLR